MKTLHKIALARAAYWALRIVHRTDQVTTKRKGILYSLDLSQGIDLSLYLFGVFEHDTAAALRKHIRPGSTVLDIGANIGAHTLLLAKHVGDNGRVIAFEPTKFAYSKLSKNLSLNPDLQKRVTALRYFLAADNDAQAPESIASSWPLTGGSDLHPKHGGEPMALESTPARNLDSVIAELGSPHIDAIKIDVDGFECSVFSGAQSILARDKPFIVMELSPYILREQNTSLGELLLLLEPHGYGFYEIPSEKCLPRDVDQLERSIGDGASINVIAKVGAA